MQYTDPNFSGSSTKSDDDEDQPSTFAGLQSQGYARPAPASGSGSSSGDLEGNTNTTSNVHPLAAPPPPPADSGSGLNPQSGTAGGVARTPSSGGNQAGGASAAPSSAEGYNAQYAQPVSPAGINFNAAVASSMDPTPASGLAPSSSPSAMAPAPGSLGSGGSTTADPYGYGQSYFGGSGGYAASGPNVLPSTSINQLSGGANGAVAPSPVSGLAPSTGPSSMSPPPGSLGSGGSTTADPYGYGQGYFGGGNAASGPTSLPPTQINQLSGGSNALQLAGNAPASSSISAPGGASDATGSGSTNGSTLSANDPFNYDRSQYTDGGMAMDAIIRAELHQNDPSYTNYGGLGANPQPGNAAAAANEASEAQRQINYTLQANGGDTSALAHNTYDRDGNVITVPGAAPGYTWTPPSATAPATPAPPGFGSNPATPANPTPPTSPTPPSGTGSGTGSGTTSSNGVQGYTGGAASATTGGSTGGTSGTPGATNTGSAGNPTFGSGATSQFSPTDPSGNLDLTTYLQNQLLNDPTGFNSQAVQDTFNTESGNIDDQYALEQKQLNDQMAARGLGTSSIYGGKLNDLNIGKRSAKAQMASQLATNEAQALTGGQQAWYNSLNNLGQQGFNNDMQTAQYNSNQQQLYDQLIRAMLGAGATS